MIVKKILFAFPFIIIFSYAALCLFMYQQQDALLYQPELSKITPEQVGAKNVEIFRVITADKIVLEGWYIAPVEKHNKVIVFFHGNGWNIGQVYNNISGYIGYGYGVLLAEYRGYAGNQGKVSEQGLYNDARAYIEWLGTNKKIKYEDMIFYGESLGSAIALNMAAEYLPNAVIVISAFSSMLDLAWERYPYIPVNILLRDQYRNDLVINKIKAPMLFLHGQKDTLVPIEYAKKLFAKATMPKEIVVYEYGDHTNLYNLGARKAVMSFLSKVHKYE